MIKKGPRCPFFIFWVTDRTEADLTVFSFLLLSGLLPVLCVLLFFRRLSFCSFFCFFFFHNNFQEISVFRFSPWNEAFRDLPSSPVFHKEEADYRKNRSPDKIDDQILHGINQSNIQVTAKPQFRPVYRRTCNAVDYIGAHFVPPDPDSQTGWYG